MKKGFLIYLALVILSTGLIPQADSNKKELSLRDAIYQALKNNLNLKIEMANTEYFWNSIKVNTAIFIPQLQAESNVGETNTPSTDIFSADITKNNRMSLSLTLNQRIPLGGEFSVQLDNRRFETNSPYATVNPSYSSTLYFQLSQPLLKNFGTFVTKKDILVATNDYQKGTHQLRQNMIDLIYEVETNYWNLVYAHQSLEAQKMALERARDLLKQNEIRVRVGTAAQIDILQAKADAARNESLLIQAEQNLQTAQENLRIVLNIVKAEETLVPVDTPEIAKIPIDFNQFLLEALDNRPDMERARLDLNTNNVNVKYARNQMLPDLQLIASYYTSGRGGDTLIYDGNPFLGGQLIGVIERSIWDSMNQVFANIYRNYSVQLNLSIPLSLQREKAQLAQAKLNLRRALLTLQQTENTVYSEVKEALKELEARANLVESNKVALELYDQRLQAEQKKLSVGLATNFEVITAQNEFLTAQTSYLRARIDYNLTLGSINRILARSLKAYDIKLTEFVNHK